MKKNLQLTAGQLRISAGNQCLIFSQDHNCSQPFSTHFFHQHYSPKTRFMEKTFMWTYNVIRSCNNDFHFDCADALISLFARKYGETEMVFQLKQLRENKWVSVHGILV
jgi:hypothetical protein